MSLPLSPLEHSIMTSSNSDPASLLKSLQLKRSLAQEQVQRLSSEIAYNQNNTSVSQKLSNKYDAAIGELLQKINLGCEVMSKKSKFSSHDMIAPLLLKFETLSRKQNFLMILLEIESLSETVRLILQNSDGDSVALLDAYHAMTAKVELLFRENVSHSIECIQQRCAILQNETIIFLGNKLVNLLSEPRNGKTDNVNISTVAFLDLIKFQNKCIKKSNSVWAIDYILEWYEIRFKYHFETNQPTNKADRPEWMFSFLKKALTANTAQLRNLHYQANEMVDGKGVLDGMDYAAYFSRGLVLLARPWIRRTLEIVLTNKKLLAHCIEETLIFEYVLEKEVSYSEMEHKFPSLKWPRAIQVFAHPTSRFQRWLHIDKEISNGIFKNLIEDRNVWDIVHFKEHNCGLEKESYIRNKAVITTHAARNFSILFSRITKRYKLLGDQYEYQMKQLSFIAQIQNSMLNSFFSALEKQAKTCSTSRQFPLTEVNLSKRWEKHCSLMTSTSYVLAMLHDTEVDTVFLKLSEAARHHENLSNSEMLPANVSERTFHDRTNFSKISPVFALFTAQYEELLETLLNDAVQKGYMTITQAFVREFFCLDSVRDDYFDQIAVSEATSEFYTFLAIAIKSLPQPLFSLLVSRTVLAVDDYLFKSLIDDQLTVSQNMSQQLLSAIERLCEIIKSHEGSDIDTMSRSREVLSILLLPSMQLSSLRNALISVRDDENLGNLHARDMLQSMHIHQLSLSDVIRVLSKKSA